MVGHWLIWDSKKVVKWSKNLCQCCILYLRCTGALSSSIMCVCVCVFLRVSIADCWIERNRIIKEKKESSPSTNDHHIDEFLLLQIYFYYDYYYCISNIYIFQALTRSNDVFLSRSLCNCCKKGDQWMDDIC